MTAAKIKALVWREWRLSRKNYLSACLVLLIITGFFWLIRLSMSVGNLAPVFQDSDFLKEFGGILYYLSTALISTVALGASLDSSALQADLTANWMCYSFALPVSPQVRATVIYIVKLIKLGIGYAFSVIAGIITAKITGMTFTGNMMWFFTAILAVMIIFDTVMQYFQTKARTAAGLNTASAKCMALFMVVMVVVAAAKAVFGKTETEPYAIDDVVQSFINDFLHYKPLIIACSLLALFIVLPLGWYFTVRHYRMFGDVNEKAESGTLFARKPKKKDGEAS